ncbi:Dabb family protein [Akkermansiaceae bacterium]|nr:Dabb family protein [Akkermansiaceae bacterium]
MQHHVYFWLKEEYQTTEKRAEYEKALDELNSIEHILRGGWGKPAATEKRPVIEDSYSYCAYTTFLSIADHDKYQAHPIHDEFLKNYKPWWEKVVIMDAE